MRKIPLFFPFFLALAFSLFGTVFFPHFRLCPFSPFLAIAYHRRPFIPSLWLSLGCGLILDLASSQMHLGLYALTYCLVTVCLYKQKRHFFEEKPVALSLFAAVISSVSGLILLLLTFAFDKQFPYSWELTLFELFVMPFFDALYAFVWFTCPMKLYAYIQRVGWKKLFKKQEEEESL